MHNTVLYFLCNKDGVGRMSTDDDLAFQCWPDHQPILQSVSLLLFIIVILTGKLTHKPCVHINVSAFVPHVLSSYNVPMSSVSFCTALFCHPWLHFLPIFIYIHLCFTGWCCTVYTFRHNLNFHPNSFTSFMWSIQCTVYLYVLCSLALWQLSLMVFVHFQDSICIVFTVIRWQLRWFPPSPFYSHSIWCTSACNPSAPPTLT